MASTTLVNDEVHVRSYYDDKGINITAFVRDLSDIRYSTKNTIIKTATWRRDNSVAKVAVKFVRVEELPSPEDLGPHLRNLRQEVSIWQRLEHDNILPFRGVFWPDAEQLPAMVADWAEEGDVEKYMVKLSCWPSKLQLLEGVALGLNYLHSKGVIHADIKSENVLVSPHGVPLMGDFGISWANVKISVTFTRDRAADRGTAPWMAPELLKEPEPGVLGYSTDSDIWAVGCLISRVLGEERPWSNKTRLTTIIASLLNREFFPRPKLLQDTQFDVYWGLVLSCCSYDVASRPSAFSVFDQLHKFLEDARAKAVTL